MNTQSAIHKLIVCLDERVEMRVRAGGRTQVVNAALEGVVGVVRVNGKENRVDIAWGGDLRARA